MTNSITPPPELVQRWIREKDGLELVVARAAQWGADQELEACCEWLFLNGYGEAATISKLIAARRPKPPSLKEQALELVNRSKSAMSVLTLSEVETIRQALEALPND
jgi:hypothetical protein